MVMEYIHFVMPRIADKETVNHICAEVNKGTTVPILSRPFFHVNLPTRI